MGKKIILGMLCGWLSGISVSTFGQDVQLYGTIPAVLLKRSVNDRLDYAFGLSSEINAVSVTTADRSFPAEVLNLNLEPVLSYDPNPNLNIAGGFLLRFNDPFSGATTEYRPWQQLTTIHRLRKYRFRNRLRAEQRWVERRAAENHDFNLRLRYRLSCDLPLEGERLDDREFYLNVSTEILITPTGDRPIYFWESRSYLGLGYRFNGRYRLEPALEFRSRRMDEAGNRRHTLFFRLVWVARLGTGR